MNVESAGPAAALWLPQKPVAAAPPKKQAKASSQSEGVERAPVRAKGPELRISVPYDHHVEIRIVDPDTGEALQVINEAPPEGSGEGRGSSAGG